MILDTFEKQPSDVQDYDIDFTAYIESMGETTGAAHTVAVEADTGLTLDSSALSAGVVKAWLSGGTDGQRYVVTATLTTAGGRVHQQEIAIRVKERA